MRVFFSGSCAEAVERRRRTVPRVCSTKYNTKICCWSPIVHTYGLSILLAELVEVSLFLSGDTLQLCVGRGHDAEDAPFLLQLLPLVHFAVFFLLFVLASRLKYDVGLFTIAL